MTRKLAATAIAIIVSIPLIPLLEKSIRRLAGTDAPAVFPAHGWNLAKQDAKLRGNASGGTQEHSAFVFDATRSLDPQALYVTDLVLRGFNDRLRSDSFLFETYLTPNAYRDDPEVASWTRFWIEPSGADFTLPGATDSRDEFWKSGGVSGAYWGSGITSVRAIRRARCRTMRRPRTPILKASRSTIGRPAI